MLLCFGSSFTWCGFVVWLVGVLVLTLLFLVLLVVCDLWICVLAVYGCVCGWWFGDCCAGGLG